VPKARFVNIAEGTESIIAGAEPPITVPRAGRQEWARRPEESGKKQGAGYDTQLTTNNLQPTTGNRQPTTYEVRRETDGTTQDSTLNAKRLPAPQTSRQAGSTLNAPPDEMKRRLAETVRRVIEEAGLSTGSGQLTTDNKQRATGNQQPTTDNKQQTTGGAGEKPETVPPTGSAPDLNTNRSARTAPRETKFIATPVEKMTPPWEERKRRLFGDRGGAADDDEAAAFAEEKLTAPTKTESEEKRYTVDPYREPLE
jgi:hypothetical protein